MPIVAVEVIDMTRCVPAWSTGRLSLQLQHPAVRLTMLAGSPLGDLPGLPVTAGVYALLAVPQQTAYIGTGENLARRVRRSAALHLPTATHVGLAEPVGMEWTNEERLALELRLARGLPGVANWQLSARPAVASRYLDEVADRALDLIRLWLVRPPEDRGRGRLPSQAAIARDLVLTELRQPYTVSELLARLRALGWSAHGQTPHKTLRRDLKSPDRGGSAAIRVTGAWSDPGTHIYVAGRAYSSGWSPPGIRRGDDSH